MKFEDIKGIEVLKDTLDEYQLKKIKDILFYDYLWIAAFQDKNFNTWIYYILDLNFNEGESFDVCLWFKIEDEDYESYLKGDISLYHSVSRSSTIYIELKDYIDNNSRIKRVLFEDCTEECLPPITSFYMK